MSHSFAGIIASSEQSRYKRLIAFVTAFAIAVACPVQTVPAPVFAASADGGLTVAEDGPDLRAVLPVVAAVLDGGMRDRNSVDNRKSGSDPVGSAMRALAILTALFIDLPSLSVAAVPVDRSAFDLPALMRLVEFPRIPIGPPTIAA